MPDEAHLVSQAAIGDDQAWRVLFERHRDQVFGLALRMVGDHGAAEDVVQEAFIKAWRKVGSLRDGRAFGTWVLRIASRLCLRRRDDPASPPAKPPELSAEDQALERESGRQLEAALRTVPAHYRVLLLLRDVQGLSYAEIASVLGCSRNAVKVRLSRARAMFRQRAAGLLTEWRDVRCDASDGKSS